MNWNKDEIHATVPHRLAATSGVAAHRRARRGHRRGADHAYKNITTGVGGSSRCTAAAFMLPMPAVVASATK